MPTARRLHRSTQSLAALSETAKTYEKPTVKKRPRWPEIPTGPDLSELAEFDALDDYPLPVWERGAP